VALLSSGTINIKEDTEKFRSFITKLSVVCGICEAIIMVPGALMHEFHGLLDILLLLHHMPKH
jgi:hypothetical protein